MTHVSIVTGASRGIGKAIVQTLLKNEGSKVVAIARSKSALESLQSEFGKDNLDIVIGDVTDALTSKKAVELAISRFGQLNSVIANAGVLDPVGSIESTSIQEWKKLYDINFFSVAQLIQEAIPELRKTKGNVVAVSSGAATTPYSGWYAYGSSKAALNHLILSLATEEKKSGVHAISIAPGVVDTNMQHDIRETFGSKMDPHHLQKFLDLHKNKQLVPAEAPGAVLANLALKGWGHLIRGKLSGGRLVGGELARTQFFPRFKSTNSSSAGSSPPPFSKAKILIVMGTLVLGTTIVAGIYNKDPPKSAVEPKSTTTATTTTSPEFPPGKISVIFVLGGPGSGKGTQCDILVKEKGFVHLSAGDLLRAEQKRPGSKYGNLIAQCIKEGKIVPQEVTIELLRNAIKENYNRGEVRFLVDGFPRKMDQALTFENNIAESAFTLFFECPEQVMMKRILERAKTSGRADDNVESIKKRFQTFIDTSMPVVEYFEKQNKVVKLSCDHPVDVVASQVLAALKSKNI
ncbi:URA6 [Candida oxycetoniae]|uniref:Uridylate kinase n=1 Tax=Candida oxycetoniae TaxID=497107 RepID=A0AAI9WZX9_9ASCO|nr:URA6 [Candida oxycetoniae]KAI3406355.1 URA6 [Candida oxycetoniae]